jgi:hypothetical protein
MTKFAKCLIVFLFLITFATSCHRRGLRVQHRFLSYNDLASQAISSPDFRRDSPATGERLAIFYNIDRALFFEKRPNMQIWIRYHHQDDEKLSIQLENPSGYEIFDVVEMKFMKSGGISSYKVQIVNEGEILEEWRHQVWAEKIVL